MSHLRRRAAGVTAFAALALAAAVPAATASTVSHGPGALPSSIVGNPKIKAGAAEGFYVWHDASGYHLWVTHPGTAKVTFTGTIVASSPVDYKPVRLESGDTVTVAPGGKSFSFSFKNFGKIDGVTFTAGGAAKVRFTLKINGVTAAPDAVHLGKKKVSPTSDPFLVERGSHAAVGA